MHGASADKHRDGTDERWVVAGMTELKPCPFCGADGLIVKFDNTTKKYCRKLPYKVKCSKCRCSLEHAFYATEEDAAAAWNRRV